MIVVEKTYVNYQALNYRYVDSHLICYHIVTARFFSFSVCFNVSPYIPHVSVVC